MIAPTGKAPISGVICPMITSFDREGAVDVAAACHVADFLIAHGIHALFVAGTTGEGMLLSLEERELLFTRLVAHVAGRVPVLAHAGCPATADTVRLVRHAAAVGASAATLITPYFHALDEESIYAHFLTVAAAAPELPLYLYTFPASARNDISPRVLGRLCRAAPNIAGLKVSNPDLLRFQEYLEVTPPSFGLLCGVDGLMLPALSLGARGQVSGNANAVPELFVNLYAAFLAGDLPAARAQQRLINRARTILADGLHPAYFKAVLNLRGVPAGCVRPPMRELSAEELAKMEVSIRELGLEI
jgi:dihydrodipicolinate synthase/N-acetylneuraminate lyase